jgi:hypothetical protein
MNAEAACRFIPIDQAKIDQGTAKRYRIASDKIDEGSNLGWIGNTEHAVGLVLGCELDHAQPSEQCLGSKPGP